MGHLAPYQNTLRRPWTDRIVCGWLDSAQPTEGPLIGGFTLPCVGTNYRTSRVKSPMKSNSVDGAVKPADQWFLSILQHFAFHNLHLKSELLVYVHTRKTERRNLILFKNPIIT